MRIVNNPFLRMLLILSSFVFAAAFLPAFGFIFLVFLPQLTFFYSTLAGKIKTATAFLIPALLISLISHLLQLNTPYPAVLIMGIVGLTIAAVALKNNPIEKIVIYPALIITGSVCAYFIYSGYKLSVNPWQLVHQFVAQGIEQNIILYTQLPLEQEEINLIKNNKNNFIAFFTGVSPALTVIGSLIIVWINVLMSKDIFRRTTIVFPQFEGLSSWKAPEFIIWIFLAAGGMLLIPNEQIRVCSMNILMVTCFIYLLQGLAIIGFLFQTKNVSFFFRYLFYFLIAVQQLLMIPIIAVGLFDIWVDFRRFLQKNQPSA